MNCPECGLPPNCQECRGMEREIARLQVKIQGLEDRLAPDNCPDCGSTATTCWDCRDTAIEELEERIVDLDTERRSLENQIHCLEDENERLTRRCMTREEELETAIRAIYTEYEDVIKDGGNLLKELLQLAEERMTETDKWADMDLQNIGRRVQKWIKENENN